MSDIFETDEIEIDGFKFKVEYHYDHDAGRPWDNSDGHGPVRETTMEDRYPAKKPGERILNRNPDRRHYVWAYDWKEACRLAKKDGWNTEPYDAPNRIERAVQADFDFLAGWVNDDWHYCWIEVKMLDDEGEVEIPGDEYTDTLCGVETHKDYHHEKAKEMAQQLATNEKVRQAEAALAAEIETNTKD